MISKHLKIKGQYWTDSLTLVSGCSPVSEGCAHCWSAGMASRFDWGKPYAKNGKWTGKVEPNYKALEKLEKRVGSERKLKPRVFCIWNDLLYPQIPCDFQLRVLHAMYYLEQDVFLILTKRPEEIENSAFCQGPFEDTELPNIYIGVSVESQKHIHRIDQLIKNWPGKKFVSIEPCLGAVDLSPEQLAELNQVIIGCESGANRRQPPDMKYLHSMLWQCSKMAVPVFLKQWDMYGKFRKMPKFDGHTYDQLTWSKTLTQEVPKGDTG